MKKNKKHRIDHDLLVLAIDELKAKNQKVNIPAIAKATGYTVGGLHACGLLDDYVTRRPRIKGKTAKEGMRIPLVNPGKIEFECHSTSDKAKEPLVQTVEAYSDVIIEGYFAHFEKLDDVQKDMAINYAGFQPSLYTQAVNRLVVSDALQTNPLKPGYFIANLSLQTSTNKSCSLVDAKFILSDVLAKKEYFFENEDSLEIKIEELSKGSKVSLKIFKAHEVIRLERKRIDGGAA